MHKKINNKSYINYIPLSWFNCLKHHSYLVQSYYTMNEQVPIPQI